MPLIFCASAMIDRLMLLSIASTRIATATANTVSSIIFRASFAAFAASAAGSSLMGHHLPSIFPNAPRKPLLLFAASHAITCI